MRIATSIFGGSTIFYVQFGVEWIGTGVEPISCNGIKLSDETTIGVCSDINNIYNYLLQSLLSLDTKCFNISNDLKKAYLILYGHIEAMKLERFEEAEYFYDILKNNFSNCNINNKISTNNCGCNT